MLAFWVHIPQGWFKDTKHWWFRKFHVPGLQKVNDDNWPYLKEMPACIPSQVRKALLAPRP